MIPAADPALALRVQHRHTDDSWHTMEPEHHTPDEHDPERGWLRGRIFRCVDCDEAVTLIPTEET